MTDVDLRPHITADRDLHGRWIVEYHGHVYPFPSFKWAIRAASDPAHLCRYACICPVISLEQEEQ